MLRRVTLYESLTLSSASISGGAPNAKPMRMPAREKDFEKVRKTSTLSYSRTNSRALASAKSTYASSTTSTPATTFASDRSAGNETAVPEGEFGLQMTVTRPRASANPDGRLKSSSYGRCTQQPSWMVTSVSYRLYVG